MEATCDELQENRLTCSSCDTLSRCVLVNGKWESFDVQICDDTQEYCDIKELKCVPNTNTGYCRQNQFVCFTEGKFPDPYDCRSYITCVSISGIMNAISNTCPDNTAYDISTEHCTLNLGADACFNDGYECEKAGDIGRWRGSDQIFYFCLQVADGVFEPRLSRCGFGEVFNGEGCIPSDQAITSTSDPITDSNTDPNTSPTQGGPFVCESEGTFIDSSNCAVYYVCDVALNLSEWECPPGTFFSTATNSCTFGSC